MSFILKGDVGFCNAVRRTLMSDLESWAPVRVTFRSNTSSFTDEFLAHRIGLIPFRKVGEGDSVELKRRGKKTVQSDEFCGIAFEAYHKNIPVVELCDNQAIDLTVFFDKRRASTHARYAQCVGVGMAKIDNERYKITFDTTGADAKELLLRALDALDNRLDDTLRELAHQPATPPRSFC